MDFRNRLVGQTAELSFMVSNTGSGPLTVDSLASDQGEFVIVSPRTPVTIPAGSRRLVEVEWTPATAGRRTAQLRVGSTDPVRPRFEVMARGNAVSSPIPDMEVTPAALDFGRGNVGRSRDMALAVRNFGPGELAVNSVSVTGAGFSLTSGAAAFRVAAGEQGSVTVRFTPTLEGAALGTLTIASNDPNRASVQVALRGTGVPAGAAVGPFINAGGVVNAASFQPSLARGSIASLFGQDLASGTAAADRLPLPTELGGARITVGGVNAPLFFVSSGQINFQIPFEAPLGAGVEMVVTRGGQSSPAVTVTIAEDAPGIFMYQRAAGATDPIILHADGQLVTPGNPAQAGETLVAYATGFGRLSNAPATGAAAPSGPLARVRAVVSATVGGAAAEVLFAGLAPGFVGLGQLNLRMPERLPAGSSLALVMRVGSAASQTVNLLVRSAAGSPAIVVSPASLDFGSVAVGQSRDLLLTIRNTGTGELNVSSLTSSNASFRVVSPQAPFRVAAGGQQTVTIRFTPTAARILTGTLTVSSDDPARGTVSVALAGVGI
jgi:uncharacterized protein (TIGR03437 family)